MDTKAKVLVCIALIGSSTFVAGIRLQNMALVVVSFVILAYLSINYGSITAISGLTIGLILLYPSPQMGWLYGRDSHRAAFGVLEILRNGWPTKSFAFTETPLLYFHAAVASKILKLPVYSGTTPKWLVTMYLPIFYLISTYLFIISIVRRFKEKVLDLSISLYMLPVIMWIPLAKFHSGFRRESMAIVFFAGIAFFIYNKNFTKPKILCALIFISGTILSHHFSPVILVLFIAVGVIVYSGYDKINLILLLTISVIVFMMWYIINGLGGPYITYVVLGVVSPDPDPNLLNTVSPSLFRLYQLALSLGVYQLILGVLITIGFLYSKIDIGKEYFKYSLAFGIVIAAVSIGAFLAIPISYDRVMSFFVIACGWIAPAGIYIYARDHLRLQPILPTKAVLVLIVIIGSSMVPVHVISSNSPDYEQGEFSQQFDQSVYPAAEFAGTYMNEEGYLSTLNLWSILRVETHQAVQSKPSLISNGTIPPDYAVVFLDWNTHLYTSKYGNIIPGDVLKESPNNRVYSNGEVSIYKSGPGL